MCSPTMLLSVAGMAFGAMQSNAQMNAQEASSRANAAAQQRQFDYQNEAQETQLRAQEAAAEVQRTQSMQESAYNQRISENNAQIQKNQAQGVKSKTQLEEAQIRLAAGQKAGAQRAQMGASGALLDTGTNASIEAGTQLDADLDALMVRTAGEKQAQAYEQTAANYQHQANLDQWGSTDYGRREAPTLLTESSPVSSKWDPWRAAA